MAALPLVPEFERIDLVYKTLDKTPFGVAVFVPKSILKPDHEKSYPVLVHFHGGALVMGTNPELPWLSKWIFQLALTTPAIFVSPAYRLVPDATGGQTLDDVQDFWGWLHASFPKELQAKFPHLAPDLTRIAAVGESAGGFLSIQSALLFNEDAQIKAILAAYPAMYPDIASYNQRPAEVDPGADAVVSEYLAKVRGDGVKPTVRVSSPWPELQDVLEAMGKTGRHRELLGDDERLTLGYALRKAGKMPPIWVIQGSEDFLVPKVSTDEMVARIKETHPETPVHYTVVPGGDHGFDNANGLDDEWVKKGVEFVRQYWS
ncbi:Alpha/Beta hydrolase protein [Lasiosphaeria hispida]|uniref:Alpha/Beta hydrolase protein n=1 Tax=Lasiosphaeria hispida TaxID=260671 RepID=A0AAJ0HH37_9PEZI|nr:Alpha/Beta hydrolase protein [Lasiosphaeria hispida]